MASDSKRRTISSDNMRDKPKLKFGMYKRSSFGLFGKRATILRSRALSPHHEAEPFVSHFHTLERFRKPTPEEITGSSKWFAIHRLQTTTCSSLEASVSIQLGIFSYPSDGIV